MINRCIFMGYVGAEPDIRYKNGVPYGVLCVVLLEKWLHEGQNKRARQAIEVKVWNERYLRVLERQGPLKGKLVYIEARLALRRKKMLDGSPYLSADVTIPRGVSLIKFIDPPASAFAAPEVEDEEGDEDEGDDGSVAPLG